MDDCLQIRFTGDESLVTDGRAERALLSVIRCLRTKRKGIQYTDIIRQPLLKVFIYLQCQNPVFLF